MSKTQTITAYCAACDGRVSKGREGDGLVQGPDGRIYCAECGEAMRLLERVHAPAETAGKSDTSAKRKPVSSARLKPPSAKPQPVAQPPASPRRIWLLLAFAGLAVAAAAAWYFLSLTRTAATERATPGETAGKGADLATSPPKRSDTPDARALEPAKEETERPTEADDFPRTSALPPAREDPPLDRLAARWETARRNVDRSRMRECLVDLLVYAPRNEEEGARKGEMAASLRTGWFEVEWSWIERQAEVTENGRGREAAREYLDRWLESVRPLLERAQLDLIEKARADLAGEE